MQNQIQKWHSKQKTLQAQSDYPMELPNIFFTFAMLVLHTF